ncbi:MAG: sulfatase-like hydrolase/transferase [Actinobacteria bacterium]|nr:sulfatase-like hydrolase/transferase [Actinomycetota bacterium]
MVAPIILIARRSPRAGRVLVVSVGGLLLGCLAVQILKRMPGIANLGGWLLLSAAFAMGASITWVYLKRGVPGFLIDWAALIPVVVLALFLGFTPASDLVFTSALQVPGDVTIGNPVPVVLVIFDEFPVTTLMDRSGSIDGTLFPHFARLAKDARWFRDTATTQWQTERAIPAILTGEDQPTGLPIAQNHPDNVFTLLDGAYEVVAQESFTALCPTDVCEESVGAPSLLERWSALASDMKVITGHLILPPDLAESLPRTDEAWAGFGQDAHGGPDAAAEPVHHRNPRTFFQRFLSSIRSRAQPGSRQAFIIHSLLPHVPWNYLPTGAHYEGGIPGRSTTKPVKWTKDEWPVLQGYQRHLLQAQYTDKLLGDLVGALKAEGIYSESLVVVVADHGVAFDPGGLQRIPVTRTVADIGLVPFFVKLPGERRAGISDQPVQTIDVLPTIADVLELRAPNYRWDGSSAFERTGPSTRLIYTHGPSYRVPTRGWGPGVQRKYEIFGAGESLDLYGIAPAGLEELLGMPTDRLPVTGEVDATAAIDRLDAYRRQDPAADDFPWLFLASLDGPDVGAAPLRIGISIGGRMRAITRTYAHEGQTASVYAMLPPDSFARSREIRLFVIGTDRSMRALPYDRS